MSNYKGGYAIIDCKSQKISETAITIPGIYEAIESQNGKPILFQNFSVGSEKVITAFLTPVVKGVVFALAVGNGFISVTSDDKIIYTDNADINGVYVMKCDAALDVGDMVKIDSNTKVVGVTEGDIFDGVVVGIAGDDYIVAYKGTFTLPADTSDIQYFGYNTGVVVGSDGKLVYSTDESVIGRTIVIVNIDTTNHTITAII